MEASFFCSHFGNQLQEHLYVEGMTRERAEMLVDAAIFMQMRRLSAGNRAMAVMYKIAKIPQQIKKFILGQDQA